MSVEVPKVCCWNVARFSISCSTNDFSKVGCCLIQPMAIIIEASSQPSWKRGLFHWADGAWEVKGICWWISVGSEVGSGDGDVRKVEVGLGRDVGLRVGVG